MICARRRAAVETKTLPGPEVVVKAQRRRFTAEHRKRILAEADAAKEPGLIGVTRRKTHRWRDAIRPDPRFQDLVRRAGFPE